MSAWNGQEKWTVGEIVHQMREEAGVGLQELSEGLCSVATMSRIETGEREMDLLMASRIFQRLGYRIDKYEFYATKEELKQWEDREQIEKLANEKEYDRLEQAIQEYEENWKLEVSKNKLQQQFVEYMKGILEQQKLNFKQSERFFQRAIRMIVPAWENKNNRVVLGEMELKILYSLGEVYECYGDTEKSEKIWDILFQNIAKEEKSIRIHLELHANIICRNTKEIQRKEATHILQVVDKCLRIMQEEKCICHWAELLQIRSRCLEMLFQEKQIEKEVMLKNWRKTYYIYLLYEKQEEAAEIRTYVKEKYQWDCMI